jgi:ketosteroid isomerase-like protein
VKIPILLFAVVAFGGILIAQNSKQGKDESAIRKADVEWSQAVEAKDLNKTVSFYADDASVYAPNAPIVTGKDNIRQAWSHMFDSPGFHLKFAPTKVEVAKSADLAYDAGTFEENVNGSDGTPITVHGKYVVVWKKQNGQWKAVADIFNADK